MKPLTVVEADRLFLSRDLIQRILETQSISRELITCSKELRDTNRKLREEHHKLMNELRQQRNSDR